MNERIRELVRESNLDVYGLGKERHRWEYTIEKFVESFVRECVQVCINEGKTFEVESAGEYSSNLYSTAIRKHFGVGE